MKQHLYLEETEIAKELYDKNKLNLLIAIIFMLISCFVVYLALINNDDIFSYLLLIIPVPISAYHYYKYYQRTTNIKTHPDLAKFFTFNNPEEYIKIMDADLKNLKNWKRLGDCQVTDNFITIGG